MTQSITVGQAAQVIDFAGPASGTYGASSTLSATGGGSGNPVVFSVGASSGAGVCAVSGTDGTEVHYTGVGSCVIDANQAASTDYAAASQVTRSFAVGKASQSINLDTAAPNSPRIGTTYTPRATATSGRAVVVAVASTSTTECSIGAGVVTFKGIGRCTLDFSQAGTANYAPSPTVTQSMSVTKGIETITVLSSVPSSPSVGSTYHPLAASTWGLAVKVTVASTSSSICSIDAGLVVFSAVGTCKLDYNQAGDADYDAARQVTQSMSVVKAAQTIQVTSTPPSSPSIGSTYVPTATSTPGLPVTIAVATSSSSVCSISAGVVTFESAGACKLTFSQAGDASYLAAPQITQSIDVT